jgi:peroxiredoxin Q/BCP
MAAHRHVVLRSSNIKSNPRRDDMLEAGTDAPDFTLLDQDGSEVTLSAHRGHPVVLYFYPKASTPGCTAQACGIRDRRPDYLAADATVFGVSKDKPRALKKFQEEEGLDFTLLSDVDHEVAEAYGVWGERSMYGKKYMGMSRSTFIIDAEGKIAHVIPKVKIEKHDEEVLEALAELGAPA